MQIPPLIIIGSIILYIGMGIGYTQMLRAHWVWFYHTTNKHQSLIVLATITWAAIFIVFITWKTFEPLTTSRRKDWDEI